MDKRGKGIDKLKDVVGVDSISGILIERGSKKD